MDEDCFLTYIPEEGRAETNRSNKTAIIKLGGEYASQDIEKVRRDLYEDLYTHLNLIFKRIESIKLEGGYLLKAFNIYDKPSLVAAAGVENIEQPVLNLSFDDRFYLETLFSKENPILISDTPVIKVDFNTRSGLIWRKCWMEIDKNEYRAAKNEFTLIVVKPYKDVASFDVDYAMYMLRIPVGRKLAFGEHHIVFEAENAYGMRIKKEAYARVVSLPTEVVGAPVVFPNPFSPMRDREAKIQYQLSMRADIEVVLFGVDGSVIMKKRFSKGEEGGKKGYNTIYWNGLSDMGLRVPNGIYSGVIIDRDGNRILDRFKLTIYQ
jgi:hypothetical protein